MEIDISTLIIRADANEQIGSGHIMRCLALAQEWICLGGQVVFAVASIGKGLRQRLQDEKVEVVYIQKESSLEEDARQTIKLVERYLAQWLVVDGYSFDEKYQAIIKENKINLLVLDDYSHCNHYHADIVVNQNIYAHENLYKNKYEKTKLLLGEKYVLLRQEFLLYRNWHREIPERAKNILITLGGGDPDNVSGKIVDYLGGLSCDNLKLVLIIGAANRFYDAIVEAAKKMPCECEVVHNSNNMAEFMVWADLAITAGGSSCWEAMFLGLPNIVFILAENQVLVAKALEKKDVSVNLGWHHQVDGEGFIKNMREMIMSGQKRRLMSGRAEQFIDGYGVDRVINKMLQRRIILRAVTTDDEDLLWHWVNESGVRRSAFSSANISMRDHEKWFSAKNNDESFVLFIALDEQLTPVGQIRFEMSSDEAEIDISVAKEYRGKGYGAEIIAAGVSIIHANYGVRLFKASIKLENTSSIIVFNKAGFATTEKVKRHGINSILLSRRTVGHEGK